MKIFPLLFSCALVGLAVTSAPGADEPFPATAGPAIAAPRTPDGFTIVNGRVFFIRDGRMMPLDREVTLRVSPSGTITAFNGQEYAIPQGQVLTLVASVAALPARSEAVASTLGPGAAATGGGSASSSGSSGSSTTASSGAATGPAGNSISPGDSTTSGSGGVSGVNMNGGGGSGFLPFDLFGIASVIPGGQHMLGPNNGVTGTIANPAGGVTNSIGAAGVAPNGATLNGAGTNIGATGANGSTAATATNGSGNNGRNPSNTPANTSVNGTAGNAPQSPTALGNQQNIGSQQIPPGSNNIGNAQNPAVIGNQQNGQQPNNQTNGTGAHGNTPANANKANGATPNTQNAGGQQLAPGNTTPTGNPGQVTPGAQTQAGQQPLNPQPNGPTTNPNATTGNTTGTAGGSAAGGAAGGGGGRGR